MSDGLDATTTGVDDHAPEIAPSTDSTRTPTEPPGPPFDVVLRGYDRRQVDAWMQEALGVVADLTDAVETARQSEVSAVAAAERATAELERGRPGFDALGERVAEMLSLAEAEAAEMRAAAERDGVALRERAARDAEEFRRATERDVAAIRKQWGAILAQVSAAHASLEAILAGSQTVGDSEATPTKALQVPRVRVQQD